MLKHLQDLGFRAGLFAAAPLPEPEIARVLAVLDEFYGPGRQVAALVPLADEAPLRAALQAAAPSLAELGQALRQRLDSSHTGVLIRRLGLSHLDPASRSFVLFALAQCIGRPTPTDKLDQRIVWDIKVRADKLREGSISTFSEHPYEADFHTDTQYFPDPERYLSLYCIQPAACGGGRSTFRDLDCILEQLSRSAAGREAVAYLQDRALPFRIPATFTSTGRADCQEVTCAPIFGERPRLRYRRDTLEAGLKVFPEQDGPELRRALGVFQAEIDAPDLRLETRLEADDFFIVNNHEALHGRSDFQDHHRHLLRIRVAELPCA